MPGQRIVAPRRIHTPQRNWGSASTLCPGVNRRLVSLVGKVPCLDVAFLEDSTSIAVLEYAPIVILMEVTTEESGSHAARL